MLGADFDVDGKLTHPAFGLDLAACLSKWDCAMLYALT